MARVLVGCECSGRVREALRALGIDAWSCDLKEAEDGSRFHIHGDVRDAIARGGWDGAIFHPDCTYLSNSGVQWLRSTKPSTASVLKGADRWAAMVEAAMFYRELRDCGIPCIEMENPLMHGYAKQIIQLGQRQVIQPHHFGDPYFKATGVELVNVPPLVRTHWMDVPNKTAEPERHAAWSAVHRESPGVNRRANRSRTYPGVAAAMADAMARALLGQQLRLVA